MQAVCDILEQLTSEAVLNGYALGGATAAGFHGEPLATRDIDVFVFLDAPKGQLLISLNPILDRLAEMGFSTFDEEAILIHDFPVQFIVATPGLESEAVEEAMVVDWENHRLRVMRPEHLAAVAMTVGRPKDRGRLVYLVSLPDFDRLKFRDVLTRHQLLDRWRSWAGGLDLDPKLD